MTTNDPTRPGPAASSTRSGESGSHPMSRARRRGWVAGIALLAVAGVVLVVLGLTSGPRAAAPIVAADTRAPVTVAAPAPPTTTTTPDLPASPPTRIAIPAI